MDKEKLNTKEILKTTLISLRMIRGAAEQNEAGYHNPTSSVSLDLLNDAEALGQSCATKLINTGNIEGEQENSWNIIVQRLSNKYLTSPISRYKGKDNETNTVGRLNSILRLLGVFSGEALNQHVHDLDKYILESGRTGLSLEDISNNQTIVLSPLSTDYLIACLLQRHIQQSDSPQSFRLKPIILDSYLIPIAIPHLKDKNLDSLCKVRVFIENNTSNETLKASLKAAQIFRGNEKFRNH